MINRSLIRIKTVQILYSFLLTRKDFKLENAPADTDSSRERQFAYSVYLDLLILLLKLNGMPLGSGRTLETDPGLKKNRVGKAMRENTDMTALLMKNRSRLSKFDSCLDEILSSVTASAVYGDYKRKRKLQMADDVAFWNTVFTTIIRKHKGVERVLRRDENFSHLGFDNGMKMFSATLMSFDDTRATYLKARNDLDKSLAMAYDLYHALLLLPVYITRLQEARLDEAKNKYLPTDEDLNPSLLFAGLLDQITASTLYKDYMQSESGDFATDAAFWREVTRSIIVPSDELAEALENRAVYWNDDLAIMSTFALKTMRRSYAATDEDSADNAPQGSVGKITLLPKFMNAADEAFGSELFEFVVKHREEYRALIDSFIDTEQWDSERLAFMDIVILLTAIAEIVHYPSIPVPVSMNEYIEIANDYSTPRSGSFVNGILYSVVKKLSADGVIDKKI